MLSAVNPLPSVLFFVMFWSLEIIATKLSFLAGAKVLPFSIQSSFSALLVLSLWTIPREGSQIKDLITNRPSLLGKICIANLIHYGLGSFCYTFGTMLTSATNVAFLVTLSTPCSSLLAVVLLKERIQRARAILLCFLVVGAYILSTNLERFTPQSGDLLVIAAAFFWSLGNVLMRKILRDSPVSGEVVSLFKPLVGIPFFLLLWSLNRFYPAPLSATFSENPFDVSLFLFAAIAGTLAALLWIFLYRSLKIAESAYVSMLGMATPVLVAIMATLLLKEPIGSAQVLGGTIIIISGVLTHIAARQPRDRSRC